MDAPAIGQLVLDLRGKLDLDLRGSYTSTRPLRTDICDLHKNLVVVTFRF